MGVGRSTASQPRQGTAHSASCRRLLRLIPHNLMSDEEHIKSTTAKRVLHAAGHFQLALSALGARRQGELGEEQP